MLCMPTKKRGKKNVWNSNSRDKEMDFIIHTTVQAFLKQAYMIHLIKKEKQACNSFYLVSFQLVQILPLNFFFFFFF